MSRSVTPRKYWKTFSKPPTSRPATMAPGMEPRPPMTVTMRPFTVSGRASSGDRMPTDAPDHRARQPAKRARDDEGDGVGVLLADAAKLRRRGLLGDGARRDPEPGAVEDVEQNHHGDDAQDEDHEQVTPHPERLKIDHHVVEHGRIGLRHARRRMHDDFVYEDQHAHRRHQRGERQVLRYEAEAADIDGVADNAGGDGGAEEHDQRRRRQQLERGQAGIGPRRWRRRHRPG